MVAVVGCLVLGSTPLVANSAASAAQTTKVVDIVGQDSFAPNQFVLSTFHFAQGIISVRHGQNVVFKNKTTDGHTMTLVAAKDLPKTVGQVNNCNLCNAVNGVYFPDPNSQQPAGFQIDKGTLTDDVAPEDADAPDPLAPGGLIQDFDTVSRTNGTAAPTIGDSTIVGPVGKPTPTSRTIQVMAKPGTVLHYMCTFHAWMQATILVTS